MNFLAFVALRDWPPCIYPSAKKNIAIGPRCWLKSFRLMIEAEIYKCAI